VPSTALLRRAAVGDHRGARPFRHVHRTGRHDRPLTESPYAGVPTFTFLKATTSRSTSSSRAWRSSTNVVPAGRELLSKLQNPTASEQAIFKKYDSPSSCRPAQDERRIDPFITMATGTSSSVRVTPPRPGQSFAEPDCQRAEPTGAPGEPGHHHLGELPDRDVLRDHEEPAAASATVQACWRRRR